MQERLGFALQLVRVADLDTQRDRGVDLSGVRFDADASGLIEDPAVDIVVELIGGYDVARRLILQAIENGKHVVTANKALLALHGREIFEAAARRGVDVAFEASVGGGIPILRALREGLAANRIESLHGIINGTTNYILTEMERTGEAFSDVLARAQELGFAELDPSFDVDGIDAAHKLTLLAAMAFGAELTFKEVPTEGIRGITPVDFESASEFGYRIKLLGIAKSHPSRGRQRAHRGPRPSDPDPRGESAGQGRRRHERDRGARRCRGADAVLRRRGRRAADRQRGRGRPDGDRTRDPARKRRGAWPRCPTCRKRCGRSRCSRSARSRDGSTCASPPSIGRACWRASPACSVTSASASSPCSRRAGGGRTARCPW